MFHYAFRGAAADDLSAVSLPDIADVAKYGYLGVDLFFVISGFVIAYSADGRTPAEFAIARFARIYPGFLAAGVIGLAATWLSHCPMPAAVLPPTAIRNNFWLSASSLSRWFC